MGRQQRLDSSEIDLMCLSISHGVQRVWLKSNMVKRLRTNFKVCLESKRLGTTP